jgi:hypothetical protein
MTFLRRIGFLALSLAALGFSGCQRSNVIQIPPAPPARLLVANFSTSQVVAYAQPLTPTTTPGAVVNVASTVDGIAADSQGNIYVPNGNVIYRYSPPLSATTVPTTITVTGAVNFRGLNFDRSGNLWITDVGTGQVLELSVPFGASPITPLRTIQCVCFSFPIEVATDIGNHLFVGNNGSGIVQVLNIPAATGVSVLTPVASLTSPTGSALGLASDIKGRLFVSEDATDTIMVYNPPFGTGNLPAFSIAAPTFTDSACIVANCEALVSPAQLHFDSTGLLFVAYQFDTTAAVTGGVAIFPPPFSGGTSANIILQGAASGLTDPVDLTFAQ